MTEDLEAAPGDGPEADAPAEPEAESESESASEMTLQQEFAALTPEMTQAMFGRPVQLLTGVILGVLMLLALLIGVTTLSRNGVPGASPSPSPTPAAQILMPV